MILFRILFGVFYGGLYDFYADDPLCLFRQAEGNGTCTAVGVYDGFSAFEISVCQCFLIENFRLLFMYLKEGVRGYFKS